MFLCQCQSLFKIADRALQLLLTHSLKNHWINPLHEGLGADERIMPFADILDDFDWNKVVDRSVSLDQKLIVVSTEECVVGVAKNVDLNHVSIQQNEFMLVINRDLVELELDLIRHHAWLEIAKGDVQIDLKFVDVFARERYTLDETTIVDSEKHRAAVRVQIGANVAGHCFQIQNSEVLKFDVNVFVNVHFAVQYEFCRFEGVGFAKVTTNFYDLLFGVRIELV